MIPANCLKRIDHRDRLKGIHQGQKASPTVNETTQVNDITQVNNWPQSKKMNTVKKMTGVKQLPQRQGGYPQAKSMPMTTQSASADHGHFFLTMGTGRFSWGYFIVNLLSLYCFGVEAFTTTRSFTGAW
jgi:hypothetical protein